MGKKKLFFQGRSEYKPIGNLYAVSRVNISTVVVSFDAPISADRTVELVFKGELIEKRTQTATSRTYSWSGLELSATDSYYVYVSSSLESSATLIGFNSYFLSVDASRLTNLRTFNLSTNSIVPTIDFTNSPLLNRIYAREPNAGCSITLGAPKNITYCYFRKGSGTKILDWENFHAGGYLNNYQSNTIVGDLSNALNLYEYVSNGGGIIEQDMSNHTLLKKFSFGSSYMHYNTLKTLLAVEYLSYSSQTITGASNPMDLSTLVNLKTLNAYNNALPRIDLTTLPITQLKTIKIAVTTAYSNDVLGAFLIRLDNEGLTNGSFTYDDDNNLSAYQTTIDSLIAKGWIFSQD